MGSEREELADQLHAVTCGCDGLGRSEQEQYVDFICDPANRDVVLRAMGGTRVASALTSYGLVPLSENLWTFEEER